MEVGFWCLCDELVLGVLDVLYIRFNDRKEPCFLSFQANQLTPSSLDAKFLGLVEASVVGVSHLFRTTADRNGAQLKKLALFLGKTCENANGMLNVVLRRNTNIPADENAVSVLVPNPDKISSGGKFLIT